MRSSHYLHHSAARRGVKQHPQRSQISQASHASPDGLHVWLAIGCACQKPTLLGNPANLQLETGRSGRNRAMFGDGRIESMPFLRQEHGFPTEIRVDACLVGQPEQALCRFPWQQLNVAATCEHGMRALIEPAPGLPLDAPAGLGQSGKG
jgi:hypothetical protein